MSILFHVLAGLIAVFTIATVFSKHILRAAVYLMAVLTLTAGLYFMIGAEFLGAIQILVYVGGIVVLLVFAVMLTQSADLLEDRPPLIRKALGLLAACVFFFGSGAMLAGSPLMESGSSEPAPTTGIADLGRRFLDAGSEGYLLPFEVISLLLLAVLIGGIVLAERRPRQDGEGRGWPQGPSPGPGRARAVPAENGRLIDHGVHL